MEIEIKKIDRTDGGGDNSGWELKIPYEFKDDFGVRTILYRKEFVATIDLNRLITDTQSNIQERNSRLQLLSSLPNFQKPL